MSWSKLKQQLESFLSPALQGKVEYRATGYRYLPDKAGICYITVNKKNVLNLNDATIPIKWYQSEQEIKNALIHIDILLSHEEIEAVRLSMNGKVPEDRLAIIARDRKITEAAKEIQAAHAALIKSNFTAVANRFLSTPIEESIDSKDILLTILALVDRRVGKKRLLNMSQKIKLKHPAVQYFYELRLHSF
ncbi:hypothetical protein ACFOQM_15075 [Paenibacillus sp. GCM10012307]|uniref:Uncharacterized protein n=1 Tax=Paenibacillus roseus TaxID=2798579 RepID=A0A934J6M3_9BACL|nr:hypothetical protein [Paenibacillus roseus]MBJ6362583.1 hypothetical protein [Paenibacillus roseus]